MTDNAQAEMVGRHYLLVKHGLYYRPNNQGYTGIKDYAGRYLAIEALGLDGVTAIHEDKAPEFSKACFDDLARAHLQGKLTEAADALERMAGEVARHRRTLTDPQRMLWRDDAEGVCPSPEMCFEYSDTVRCGPCAIKQAKRLDVESNLGVPNLPAVYRLNREVAALREALGKIADGEERRDHAGCTFVEDHPDAMEIARQALATSMAQGGD